MTKETIKKIIKKMLEDGHINFPEILMHCGVDTRLIKDDAQKIILEKLKSDSDADPSLRDVLIGLATIIETNAGQITTITDMFGRSYDKVDDLYLYILMNSPGEIDWSKEYHDGTTYQDASKAKLLLAALRKGYPDKDDPKFKFIFALLAKYHTHIGVMNENFYKILESILNKQEGVIRVYELDGETMEYKCPDGLSYTDIIDVIEDFAPAWNEHLQAISKTHEMNKSKVSILMSSGGTAHLSAARVEANKLENKGIEVATLNETTQLTMDPLSICLGFNIGINYSEINQKRDDKVLYTAIGNIARFIGTIVPDGRMDELRSQVSDSKIVLSVNTFAHDSRLVADGHVVYFDVIDAGQVNGKCNGLVRQVVEFNLNNNIVIVTHPPAMPKFEDSRGYVVQIPSMPNEIINTKYPVHAVVSDLEQFKKQFGIVSDRKLSILTFGGQGCLGQSEPFLKALIDPNCFPEGNLDILLLAGTNYKAYIKETTEMLKKQGVATTGQKEETLNFGEHSITYTAIKLDSGKSIKILHWVDPEIMGLLQLSCDQYICKPGAGTANEVYDRQAKGVVVVYNPKYWWEQGNASEVLEAAGATLISAEQALKHEELVNMLPVTMGKMLKKLGTDEVPSAAEHIITQIESSLKTGLIV